MTRRIRFSIAQTIAIIGWYIHYCVSYRQCTDVNPTRYASSIALTIFTTIAVKIFRHESPPDYVFTEAFYYTIFSTGLYFFLATIMMVTVVGHCKGHYDKELRLTRNQRTLILQTIVFLVYDYQIRCFGDRRLGIPRCLLLGTLVAILTIGLGDYSLFDESCSSSSFPFATGEIIVLGLIVSSIGCLSSRPRGTNECTNAIKTPRDVYKKAVKYKTASPSANDSNKNLNSFAKPKIMQLKSVVG